jgi:hypothetical protein
MWHGGLCTGFMMFSPQADRRDKKPFLKKKMEKGREPLQTKSASLVSIFDGTNKTFWLEEGRQAALLTILHRWTWGAKTCKWGIPFAMFESITAKIRHAFTLLLEGWGLMSPCNWVMHKCPHVIYLHQNCTLNKAICDIRVMLQNSVSSPIHCKVLVASWPNYIEIVDASSHGVGRVIVGELSELPLTVF